MGLNSYIDCTSCLCVDSERQPEEPFLFGAEILPYPSMFPAGLPVLTQV